MQQQPSVIYNADHILDVTSVFLINDVLAKNIGYKIMLRADSAFCSCTIIDSQDQPIAKCEDQEMSAAVTTCIQALYDVSEKYIDEYFDS